MPVDDQQLLLEVYKDQIAQGRHLETQRLEVTKLTLAAATALIGLAGTLKFSIHCLPICFAIILLGSLGISFTKAYIERFDGHMKRARAVRQKLDNLVASGAIQSTFDALPVVKTRRIRAFWLKIHVGVIVLGLAAVTWNVGTIAARGRFQTGTIVQKLWGQLAFEDAVSCKK